LINTKAAEVATSTAAMVAAVVKCKEDAFDAFTAAKEAAKTERNAKLTAIENLKTAPKADFTDGGRCEKSFAKPGKRNEKTCRGSENLCCGAATGTAPNGATMTMEICQDKTKESYSYVGPRLPMATVLPAAVDLPFKCIQGAKKLAAAATAAAAAVYMLA